MKMREETIERIVRTYGHEGRMIIHDVQSGYRNHSYRVSFGGDDINLILYKSEPSILRRITNANAVSSHLAEYGLPVRRPLDERIITLQAGDRIKYGALYDYLPGNTIPWESYSQRPIKLLGEMLGKIHSTLLTFDDSELAATSMVTAEYTALLSRMKVYFMDSRIKRAASRKLGTALDTGVFETFEDLLWIASRLPDQQALHMDFVRSNVLFDTDRQTGAIYIIGVLDFEKAAYGHPLFDVARTLAFLLVDCKYKPEDKIRKYFLRSGYRKRGGGTIRNYTVSIRGKRYQVLEMLINLFLLHDYYKFLKHNPYEYLAENEHYVRTRDMLLRRGIVLSAHAETDLATR